MQAAIAQVGWTHHIQLLDAFAPTATYRPGTKAQIDLKLHQCTGAAVTNFAQALGYVEGGTALAATKDPYVLDFIDLAEDAKERQLEAALGPGESRAFCASSASASPTTAVSSL